MGNFLELFWTFRGNRQVSFLGSLLWLLKTVQILKDYTKKKALYITAFADDFIDRLEGNNSQGIEIRANYRVKVFNNPSKRQNMHTSV